MFRRIRKFLRRSSPAKEEGTVVVASRIAAASPSMIGEAPAAAPRADTNIVFFGENVQASIETKGKHNTVEIEGADHPSTIRVIVTGDYNTVKIGRLYKSDKLTIRVGNHRPAYGATIKIGEGLSIAHNCEFLLPNSLTSLSIGKGCLFSRDIIIRCGESPHLVFDRKTAEYLDVSDGVVIGDHVWVGERAYITKRASIAEASIVAACAIVTKRFTEDHVVLAGNPAKVVRRDVQWFQNPKSLGEGSEFGKALGERDDFARQEARHRYLASQDQTSRSSDDDISS